MTAALHCSNLWNREFFPSTIRFVSLGCKPPCRRAGVYVWQQVPCQQPIGDERRGSALVTRGGGRMGTLRCILYNLIGGGLSMNPGDQGDVSRPVPPLKRTAAPRALIVDDDPGFLLGLGRTRQARGLRGGQRRHLEAGPRGDRGESARHPARRPSSAGRQRARPSGRFRARPRPPRSS